jgi:hypothetical protein
MSSPLRGNDLITPVATPPALTSANPSAKQYQPPSTQFIPFTDSTESFPASAGSRITPTEVLLAGSLAAGVLWSLGISHKAEKPGISLSQLGNKVPTRDLNVGLGMPIGWWLDRAEGLRRMIISNTAEAVASVFGEFLGHAVYSGVNAGLTLLTSRRYYRERRLGGNFINSTHHVSRVWVNNYVKLLGEGLGDKSADGLLVSLGTLQHATLAERTAWQVAENVAGLPHGEAHSVTQVAIARLGALAEGRRLITAKDVAQDVAKLYLSRRARRIVQNESQVAYNFGVQLVLMNAQKKGFLAADTQKVWVTAVDERVCPVCAPMDSVAVGIDEPFHVRHHIGVLAKDVALWVPPAHPNCRCRVVPSTTVSHGIITRTARFARDDQDRARLKSRLADIVQQGPSWTEEMSGKTG